MRRTHKDAVIAALLMAIGLTLLGLCNHVITSEDNLATRISSGLTELKLKWNNGGDAR